MRERIQQTCDEIDVHIVREVLARDHVHLFLSILPKLSLSGHTLSMSRLVRTCLTVTIQEVARFLRIVAVRNSRSSLNYCHAI